jgi:chromosome transmission fidelity protein 1
MLQEVGMIVSNICQLVDGGVVVFFPSYAFEETFFEAWTATGVISSLEV